MNKKELSVLLSTLQTFSKQDVELEQYQTECNIAADVLWQMYLASHVEKKLVADLGCGTGIFGLGALILGAKKVYFVDVDKQALSIAKKNKKLLEKKIGVKLSCSFMNKDVKKFKNKVDTVIQNPPFGVQKSHADKPFLFVAMNCGKVVYTFHKLETKNFVESFVEDHGWTAVLSTTYKFPLKKTLSFHRKRLYFVDVGVWVLER